jgi:hypothetical protein
VLGDTVDLRIDVEYTTDTNNDSFLVELELGIGATPYRLPIDETLIKVAGVAQRTYIYKIYMGDNNTLDNPARLLVTADSANDTVKVNGWFVTAVGMRAN